MKTKILALLFIASLGFAAETKPTPSPTPTPDPIVAVQKDLEATKATLTTTQQALGVIQQQRNQLSAAQLDAQASIAVLQGMLENANKKIAELEAPKPTPSPAPSPTPTK